MPQLSPLNWILLFSFAWFSVLLFFILIWWCSKIDLLYSNQSFVIERNKWNWYMLITF
uniref:ATP synthase complex subunit 8 n=1 Tax=Coralliophila richardi TaxID=2991502 RepID=A0A9E8G3A2_9CAEN|nr:ATP synthase F0 subunit 8 [Coralliophila richardi]UZT26951.1 ATP synthase F0 subunit 8 [Coralliophila richardi]